MRKRSKIAWQEAGSIKKRVGRLTELCQLGHLKGDRLFCVESTGAKTRAYARIWGLARIWQQSLGIAPAYVLEVISEHFSQLNKQQQDQVLIHELLHIPKNFSGALLSHKRKGGVNEKLVRKLYMKIKKDE